MAFRANLMTTWAFLATATLWLRARTRERIGLSPLSNDWLVEMERRSIRGQY
jgi:hypothetical protein